MYYHARKHPDSVPSMGSMHATYTHKELMDTIKTITHFRTVPILRGFMES
jgi:hypothetical protein